MGADLLPMKMPAKAAVMEVTEPCRSLPFIRYLLHTLFIQPHVLCLFMLFIVAKLDGKLV